VAPVAKQAGESTDGISGATVIRVSMEAAASPGTLLQSVNKVAPGADRELGSSLDIVFLPVFF
jgi:hypothetical protein